MEAGLHERERSAERTNSPPMAGDALGWDLESRLLSIIDSAMDAIITVDESQKVVMFNQAASRVFGVGVADAIGQGLDRFIPERFRAGHSHHVRAFGKTGETTRVMGRLSTLRGLRADGKEFPIEASISHAMVGGKRLFTVILRDVSEKQRLEAQLMQSQKMEGIGRLAGGVAHDFNNLLMAMFNFLSLATRSLEEGHPARQSIARAQEAAERAAGLTRQLLAFARKQPIEARVVSPGEIVHGMEPMLRRLLGEDLVLRTMVDAEAGNVRADQSQLEQVLMNLVINARDAMASGGTLTIEVRHESLDEAYCRSRVGATPGEHVMIAVTDTGSGMSDEVLSRIFEPFFTTKPPGKGTGLGLAMCHGIVKASGGHIAVYSEPGHGTSFKVFLARSGAEPGEATPRTARAPMRGGSETVLLAEDSEVVRELAEVALKGAGYRVLTAESGKRALEVAASHVGTIHLLVTDLVMPEMGGVELIRALRRERKSLRAVVMSGYTEQTIADHASEAEVVLEKPFMTDVLLAKVREVLDRPAITSRVASSSNG